MTALTWLLDALAVLGVLIATSSITVLLWPAAVARVLSRARVLGPLLTAECFRCDTPVLRSRAEEMPVVFGDEPSDALTIKFCDECSRRMTFEDRLEILRGETERRADDA